MPVTGPVPTAVTSQTLITSLLGEMKVVLN